MPGKVSLAMLPRALDKGFGVVFARICYKPGLPGKVFQAMLPRALDKGFGVVFVWICYKPGLPGKVSSAKFPGALDKIWGSICPDLRQAGLARQGFLSHAPKRA